MDGVESELATRYSARIEHIYILRIARQFGFFQFLSLLDQLLDALFLHRVGRTMRLPDKTVVRVFSGIHRAHAIEFAHLYRREQMVHSKWIIRMTRQNAFEVLNRGVIVEVVIVLEGRLVQSVVGTKITGNGCVGSPTKLSQNEQYCDA